MKGLVIIEILDENDGKEYPVRLYIPKSELGEEKNSGYVSIEDVRKNPDYHRAYKATLIQELNEIKNKIKAYSEFSKVVSAIEAVKI